ncbi:protein of unknown function [Tenacibaculum sp. 190524A02b]|uniref:hypothetical protein n=1 Tax=Tenacibaculum vairaonense TaxID=3137860 RepID=UPI0032B135EC
MKQSFYILFFLVFIFNSCKQPKSIVNSRNNSYTTILLKELIFSSNNYKDKPIEVEGFFTFKMEESSISINENSSYSEKVWLEFDFYKELRSQKGKYFFKDNNLLNYNSKKIKIRGIYNIKYKGHMSWYKGSINVKEFIYNDEKYLIDTLSYGNDYPAN